jgi:UDP-glucose 4-epimerase
LKVLITGGSGFIGSNLINRLKQNKDIIIYSLVRNDQVKETPGVINISADLETLDFTKQLPAGIDCIIHMAQSGNYRDFPSKSLSIFNVNIRSTQILLDWAYQNKVKKFLYFSSGNVYKQQDKLLSETDAAEPSNFYGTSKHIAEQLCKAYAGHFDVYILRPFAIYGPGQNGMFIQNILQRIEKEEKVILASNIGLKITPLYISDCITAITAILSLPEKKTCVTYNLCGSEVINMLQLAEQIGTLINKKPGFSLNQDSPVCLMGDNSKICNDLNFKIETDFRSGLRKTIEAISARRT